MEIKSGCFYFLRNNDIIEVFATDLPTERPILAVLYMEKGWQAMRYSKLGRLMDIHTSVLDISTLPSGAFHEIDRQTLQKLRTSGRIPARPKQRRSVGVQRVQRAVNGRGPAHRSEDS